LIEIAYDLILKRTLASQMSDAKLERTNVKLKQTITVKFSRLLVRFAFEGFLKVYFEGHDDDEEQEGCCQR
jgi:DNA topoisomerase-1